MNVLLYTPGTNETGSQLRRMIKALVVKGEVETYRTISSLSSRLCLCIYDQTIAVLFAADKEQLSDLLSIYELLRDVRVILIVPDPEGDTISKGHTLRPRFLTCAGSDLGEVGAVLDKMLGQ